MAAAVVATAATVDQWRTCGAVVQQTWRTAIVNFLRARKRKTVKYEREEASFRVFVVAKSVKPVTIIDFPFFPTAGNDLPFAVTAAHSNILARRSIENYSMFLFFCIRFFNNYSKLFVVGGCNNEDKDE